MRWEMAGGVELVFSEIILFLINYWHFINVLIFTRVNSSFQVTPQPDIFCCVTWFYSSNLNTLAKEWSNFHFLSQLFYTLHLPLLKIFLLWSYFLWISHLTISIHIIRQIRLWHHILPIIKSFSLILIKTEIKI